MKIKEQIWQKLTDKYAPEYLEVVNESHQHNVPENSETHFKVILVSDYFESQGRVQRQRDVYSLLSEELEGPVHALSLRLLTKQEWKNTTQVPESPACRGGDKLD